MGVESLIGLGALVPGICTSSTRPTAPRQGQCIYETDTGNLLFYYGATTGWQKSWGQPWGRLSTVTINAATGGIGAAVTDINLATASPSSVINRRLRWTLRLPRIIQATTAGETAILMTNSANTEVGTANRWQVYLIVGAAGSVAIDAEETVAATGTVTRKFRGATSAGSFTVDALSFPGLLTVDDVGGIGSPPSS